MGVDNPFCDRHPQAATIHLRCEKWLEDPPLLLTGQTRAVVTHGYRHRGISIEVGIDTTDLDAHRIVAGGRESWGW